jgi:hypothetical protein
VNIKRNVIEHCAVSEFSDQMLYLDYGRIRRHDQNDEWLRKVKSLSH